jgi:tRNA(fMet)-specific endonuclease VapC
VQASFPIVAYDEIAADWHGRERARLEKLARPTPYTEAQIAAIAHVNGLILATFNTKDFVRYQGLEVEDWSKRRHSELT